jgi:hypothetical protein
MFIHLSNEFNLTNGFFKTINKKIKIELNNISNNADSYAKYISFAYGLIEIFKKKKDQNQLNF